MLEARIKKQLRDFTLDLSLRVENGSITVLMGENGAGKSTTLNLIAGLLAPDAGSIRINGATVFDTAAGMNIPVEERRIGYVLQRSAVFPHMTVEENIAFGLKAYRKDRSFRKDQVAFWLESMDITDIATIKGSRLSGGQKQRVALARALAIRPGLLLLDEPFAALDARSIVTVKDLIREQVTTLNIPCLFVTHRMADVQEIGDAVVVLDQGKKSGERSTSALPLFFVKPGLGVPRPNGSGPGLTRVKIPSPPAPADSSAIPGSRGSS